MKHFTHLFLLVALTIFTSQAFSQSDLQVTTFEISSASGSVPPNFSTVVSYTMKNNGTNIIPAGSAYVRTVSRGILPIVGPDNLVFANALNPGESITLTASSGNYTFGTGAVENVCVSAFLTTVGDLDSLNNVFCENFTVSSAVSNDIALVELTTITPSINVLDGFDLDNGTETPPAITMMNLKIANNGDIEYLSAQILIDLVCDASSFQAVGSISNFLPGDTVDVEISNTAIIPALPNEVGSYTMCVSLVGSDDEPNNDETCFGFTLVDLYIPPPPVGVEETMNESYVVAFTNDFISVSNVTSGLNASIVDLNGRVIATEAINTDKKIDLSTLTSGVYFLQTSNTATGEVKMNKFSKF